MDSDPPFESGDDDNLVRAQGMYLKGSETSAVPGKHTLRQVAGGQRSLVCYDFRTGASSQYAVRAPLFAARLRFGQSRHSQR
jgi:hypothetical protein